MWLKAHNYLYRDIAINHGLLDTLVPEGDLPVHIEHVTPSHQMDTPLSRYDNQDPPDGSIDSLQSVLISDVDIRATPSELRAAAARHLTTNGAGILQIPRGSDPESDFGNYELFPRMFPVLFPYGIGGIEHPCRRPRVSFQNHVKHLLNLNDPRFQIHHAFQFIAFNIIQRREVIRGTFSRVQRASFDSVARRFASVTADEIAAVSERMSQKDFFTAYTPGERVALELMKEVKIVNTSVMGTPAARINMRNQIRGLMHSFGMPLFYLTVNPPDVYNPLIKLLAGESIDIDALLPNDIPQYFQQSIYVARNPVIAAEFFHVVMEAFIKSILGYEEGDACKRGALGVVKAYYGCVEAQGRGSLHCHMFIWIEGGLGPNALRDRLLADESFKSRLFSYIASVISTSAPPSATPRNLLDRTRHPCTVRRPQKKTGENDDDFSRRLADDFHLLVEECQRHKHTDTCFKYNLSRKQCRFRLDAANVLFETVFDPETGSC
jgi:hypothetical protein